MNDPDKVEKASTVAQVPWLRLSVFVLVCGFVITMQTPLAEKVWNRFAPKRVTESSNQVEQNEVVKIEPAITPELDVPVILEPEDDAVSSSSNIRKMSKGFQLETKVTLGKGASATEVRERDDSYKAIYEVKLDLPAATITLDGLEKVNPKLGQLLPGLKEMVPDAKVSAYFHELYRRKSERIQKNATDLNDIMTRHNLYDCETILNLTHPKSGRKALLVQAEMDVVSDGSDGDRLPTMPKKITTSSHYQPMTSYGWEKTGRTENPLIAGWKTRIGKARAEISNPATKKDRAAWLKARIKKIQVEIADMEKRSFLIAEYDPFIVMPVAMVIARDDDYKARVGDYAAVIYKDKIYPAIVGDAGPSHKIGEASLRMCKELNAKANSYHRPVSDLAVTYLVFPRSADKFQEPNYELWRSQCLKFINEIGGLGEGYTLHSWENTFPEPIRVLNSSVAEELNASGSITPVAPSSISPVVPSTPSTITPVAPQ